MQEQGYDTFDVVPQCAVCGRPMRLVGTGVMRNNATNEIKDYLEYKCGNDGTYAQTFDTTQTIAKSVVAHDNTPDVEITQEDLDLLRAALEMAITCKEVEVDVAQAEADARADTLRDLVVLQRKMAEGS